MEQVSSEASPSPQLVRQRARNRIIEYLELASSFEAQVNYQSAVAGVHVPHEVINQWDELSPDSQPLWPGWLAGACSAQEIDAVWTFQREWEWVAAHTPNPLPALAELQRTPEWGRFRDAAEAALLTFSARGRLPENREV